MIYLAHNIVDPDEIRFFQGGSNDQFLYLIGRYVVRNKITAMISVFKRDGKVWTGWTGYQSESAKYLKEKRDESVRIYLREK